MAFDPNASNLSQEQILQQVFNETTGQLEVNAQVTATISNIEIKDASTGYAMNINSDGSIDANVVVSAAGGDSIRISDGTDTAAINADGDLQTVQYKKYSTLNSTTAVLNAGATFTGTAEETDKFSNVVVNVKASHASATDGLVLEFSSDGTNWDTNDTYSVAAANGDSVSASLSAKYFRVRYTNGGTNQSYFRLSTTFFPFAPKPSSHRLQDELDDQNDVEIVKATISGRTDGGVYKNIPTDIHGHLEVTVHGPRNPFGSLHTESLDPVFQYDAVYGINTNNILTTVNASGIVTAADSMFVCQTGSTIYGAGSLTTNERIIYRAGQGTVGRFTALFTTGVANSYQIAGFGNPEDGFYVGYVGTSAGLLYGRGGVREVRTLTISTKSSTAENAVVTLNGTAFNVAVTNGASTVTTAYEISQGNYGIGWKAEAIGSTVLFINTSVGAKSGTYSITGSTVVGSFAQTKAGVALTEVHTPQASFNIDPMDGTGPSGFTIDWTKLNIFQCHIQYLGSGNITWYVEYAPDGNNPVWLPFHSYQFPNTRTVPTVGNPSFQFQLSAYSAGSTTDLTVKSGSVAAFNEGPRTVHGDRYSYINTSTVVGAGSFLPLFTVRNTRYFGSRSNQSVIKLLDIGAAIKHTSPVIIYLFKNATLTGSPNFSQYHTTSCSYVDTSATAATISNNSQLIWSGPLGDTGNIEWGFNGNDIRILPGETITVAARAVTGTPAYVTCTLNTKEFQ